MLRFGRDSKITVLAALLILAAIGPAGAAPGPLATPGGLVFYTAAITIIAAFFLVNQALSNRVGVYYAALFALMLIVIWGIEGGLAATFPGLSGRTVRALVMSVGLGAAAIGFFTAEQAIDPEKRLLISRRWLRRMVWVCLGLLPLAWIWPGGLIAIAANALIFTMFVAQLLSTLTWRTFEAKAFRLPVFVTALLVLAFCVLFGLLLWGTNRDVIISASGFRIIFTLITVPTMASIVSSLISMRRSRDAALEAALAAARKDAETSAALLDMEKNYARAREVAARRTRQLSTASHDIRQPLASMRAEIDALKGDANPATLERLARVLDHIDALTAELSRSGDTAPAQDTGAESHNEDIPASLLLGTLDRMYGAQARAKGIELTFCPSSKAFRAPPLVLMRMAGNLIANAMAHAEPDRILVGIRRKGASLRVDILDDGKGFEGSDAEPAFAAGVKGAASDGSGLGLSIVRELAEEHGMRVTCGTREGRGTRFSIHVPAAR